MHTLGAGEVPPSQPPSLVQRPPPISQGDSPYHHPPTPLHSHPTVSSPVSQGEERPCLSHACGHPTPALAGAKNPHHPCSDPLAVSPPLPLPVPKAMTKKQKRGSGNAWSTVRPHLPHPGKMRTLGRTPPSSGEDQHPFSSQAARESVASTPGAPSALPYLTTPQARPAFLLLLTHSFLVQ